MYDNYNYPPGADTPDAPWNEVESPEIEFDAQACVTLSKRDTVLTDRVYCEDGDWELCDDVTAREVWTDNYMSIPALLDELVRYINGELEGQPSYQRRDQLELMKASAQGWKMDDAEYEFI